MSQNDFQIHEISPKDYTTILNEVASPPIHIYVRGNAELLSSKNMCICIIGSRKHSLYGDQVTRHLIETLAPYNPLIISGLATGIDTLALTYALSYNLQCIAVLGSGIDDESIYPRSNLGLAHQILNTGGLIISEYPAGTPPNKWQFPLRNRIMAGLSQAIVIVEGGDKSGTLITARIGLEFNRDIICIPGSIFSELSQGPLSLIQEGAIPLTRISDILEILKLKNADQSSTQLELMDSPSFELRYSRCNEIEKKILSALSTPLDRNELILLTSIPINILQPVLMSLEIKGLICEKYGKIVRL